MRRMRIRNRERRQAWRKKLTEDFHEGFGFFEGKRVLGVGKFGSATTLGVRKLCVRSILTARDMRQGIEGQQ